jgi:uncharacterized damage-inducible protein DinB
MPVPTAEQIQEYEATPEKIAAAIEGLHEGQLQQRPASDDWSIREVLVHLGDSEIFVYERFRRILADDKPVLQAFNEEAWAKNLNYREQNPDLALNLFRALRQSNAALLRALPTQAWERTGRHTERGDMSLYDVFTTYLRHGNIHLEQIEQVKKTL